MNNYDFQDRTAIVTGGGQGIGFSVAKRILEGGGKVAVWDVDQELLNSLIENLGGKDKVFNLNVTSQNVKYRKIFSPMFLPENNNYNGYYCFENWWQSGKNLKDIDHTIRKKWWKSQNKGFRKYPKTDYSVNNVLYAQWEEFGEKKFDYIESRKLVYVPQYLNLIKDNNKFNELKAIINKGTNVFIIDQDGPYSIDNKKPIIQEVNLELLKNKINYERDPFGHGYIVAAELLNIDHNEYIK